VSLSKILILILGAYLIRVIFPRANRRWALLASSVLAIFWLQPALPLRNMDFWFPTATLGVVILCWSLTADKTQLRDRRNWMALGMAFTLIILIGATRFISLEGLLTATRPPQIYQLIIALVIISGLSYILVRWFKPSKVSLTIGILVLLLFFLILKNPYIWFRQLLAQDPALAQPTDFGWLGFSYLAFRLIHTLIDLKNGRLKSITLDELLIYTIFFPAFMAGPLDRLQRFRKDLDGAAPLQAADVLKSGKRLGMGLFRKFILADSLAFFAITATRVGQVETAFWLWFMLTAYSFQLFFDFAGYTDIAIGTGMLLGFDLPENFNRPYRNPNLTLFWNNWHMTLTQWFRGYFFNPITRTLRKKGTLSAPLIIFITQMSTMIVIGLWHGVTLNFFIWGAWHGLGLFIHNRWSSFAGAKVTALTDHQPKLKHLFTACGVLATFLFVSLGWVWFALPTTRLAVTAFAKLFGVG